MEGVTIFVPGILFNFENCFQINYVHLFKIHCKLYIIIVYTNLSIFYKYLYIPVE